MKAKTSILTISIFFIGLIFTACKKELDVPNEDFKNLYGKWKWTSSNGGLFPHASSPATEGFTKTIEFDKNGKFKSYKNDKKDAKHNYSFSYEETIFFTEKRYLVIYKDNKGNEIGPRQSFEFNGPNTLILVDECYDCMSHTYVRK